MGDNSTNREEDILKAVNELAGRVAQIDGRSSHPVGGGIVYTVTMRLRTSRNTSRCRHAKSMNRRRWSGLRLVARTQRRYREEHWAEDRGSWVAVSFPINEHAVQCPHAFSKPPGPATRGYPCRR